MATLEAPIRPHLRFHDAPFVNEPFTDFSAEHIARRMRAAIEKVRGELGREYDLVIGGKRSKTQEKIQSINPARPSQVVGRHQRAGKEHVEPRCKPRFMPLNPGAGRPSRNARACCSVSPISCASANWNSVPGWCSK